MKNFITLFIIVSLLGCSNSSTLESEINFSLIKKGSLNGSEGVTQSNLIVNDNTTWNDILNKIVSIGNPIDHFTETNIDFNRYQIIASFDKVYGVGGHTLNIETIKESGNNLVVITKKTDDKSVISVVSQPYHIVKILKTDKNIVFE